MLPTSLGQPFCKGWAFDDCVPECLSVLTKYEARLISLRLPCVYSWRSKGGFGQFASRGAPVSFSNPVAELVLTLPRRPSAVFKVLLENGSQIDVNVDRVRAALYWLKANNPLYSDVFIDEDAFEDPAFVQNDGGNHVHASVTECPNVTSTSSVPLHVASNAAASEATLGSQGPLDGEALHFLSEATTVGVEETDNWQNSQRLIQHILRPFKHRRSHMLPTSDAAYNLEAYFPCHFPYGRGGPRSTGLQLGVWIKHALSVYRSRFASDVDFLFFLHSVQRRRRITGLSANANIRDTCTKALIDIRELLSGDLPSFVVAGRIEKLIRSGILNASVEKLRGSPAFWATLKRTSWAYLTHFGPCQFF